MRKNCHRLRGCGLLGALLLSVAWCGFGAQVWAGEAECVRLYRSKKLLQAANCFEALANQLKRAKDPASRRRVMRGRAIRNAASLLSRIAGSTQSVARSAWLRERAIGLLQLFLKEKLYELSERQKQVSMQLYKLRQAIRYSHLTVVTHDPEASFAISGYKMQAQGQGRWSQRVRPGTYEISMGTRRRRVEAQPGQAAVVVFSNQQTRATPKTRRRTIAPWILMAIGGGLVLGGGVFVGIAEGVDQAKVQQNLELLAQPNMPAAQRIEGVKQIEALQGQAQALYAVGWTLLITGVLATAGGVTWYWWPRRKTKATALTRSPAGGAQPATARSGAISNRLVTHHQGLLPSLAGKPLLTLWRTP